ncbi:expressed unknown protein [Seminavis robusta]|uniref:Uncharacterized protein n=1 Tax=Seminavis robusta TaxID=568900 RepID=A0A9N8EZD7_9STRA|nr:expressed unknown protein [Seminavis robusta]|eukprot:Sro2212_g319240.1 n/a (373) ;mRNA; f:2627-3745
MAMLLPPPVLLLSLLLLLLIRPSYGFSTPRNGKALWNNKSPSKVPLYSTANTQASIPSEFQEESINSALAARACARASALSAVVDMGIHALELVDSGGVTTTSIRSILLQDGNILASLRTIWKLGFAGNLWFASSLMAKKGQASPQDAQRGLTTMTKVWRITGIVVSISTATNLAVAWQSRVTRIREGIAVVMAGVIALVFWKSQQQTKGLEEQSHHNDNNNSDNDNNLLVETLRRQGKTMSRAMLFCTASFLLQIGFIPLIALSHATYSWQEVILTLLNLPTPLALVSALRRLRKSFLQVLWQAQPLQGSSSNQVALPSETFHKWTQGQQQFYGEARSAFRADLIMKILFTLASPRGIGKIIITLFAAKVG